MGDVERWLSAGADQVDPGAAPAWMRPLLGRVHRLDAATLSRTDPPATGAADRQAAVLMLVGSDGTTGPFVVLQERSSRLRNHPGEIAFPGGRREPADLGPVDTALREAAEEVTLDPATVAAVALLPRLHIVASGFDVTAVLAFWRTPGALAADGAETTTVLRVPLADVGDRAGWYELQHPVGWTGYALDHRVGTIWGYTADLLRAVIVAGLARR